MTESPMTIGMRRFLVLTSVLAFTGGFFAYVPSGRTEDWFAWTIKPPLTAAFLGANFWAAALAALVASRQRAWERARLLIPAVFTLMMLTLVITFMHLDKFDLKSVFGWAWLTAYLAFPAGLLAVLGPQLRVRGGEPARRSAPPWTVLVLGLYTTVLLGVGLGLFLQPELTAQVWPWPLTPLTGRAIGAWLIALAVTALGGCLEAAWDRLYPISVFYAGVGVFQLIALARYSGDADWDRPYAWIYLGAVVGLLALGSYGLYGAQAGRVVDGR